jgi:opacity protein-like surface antigen
MKLFASAAAALLLLAVSAFAADVDGKWTGSVSTPNGDFPVTFNFTAAGDVLNGSMSAPDGGDIAIKDGKIDGANISFWLSLDMGGQALKLTYKGVVASDQIKISGDAGGMPFEFVVKKAS